MPPISVARSNSSIAANVVVDAVVRRELAEDLTARTVDACVPLIDRPGVPEHVRALTSQHVLDAEGDLTTRLAHRATTPRARLDPIATDAESGVDPVQREVVRTLAAGADLVVIEGAAGAGKTTTLAAARTAIEQYDGRLRVVTPTLKAARVAARQVGGDVPSAWLAYQHGFRWHENGTWTRLRVGDIDAGTGVVYAGPRADAVLTATDVLLIDEAGMLDQDTARALLIVADERHTLGRFGRRRTNCRPSVAGECSTWPSATRTQKPTANSMRRTANPRCHDGLQRHHPRRWRTRTTRGRSADGGRRRPRRRVRRAARGTDPPPTHAIALVRARPARCRSTRQYIPMVVVADTNEQAAALNGAIRGQRVELDESMTRALLLAEEYASVPVTGSSPAGTNSEIEVANAVPGPSPASTASDRRLLLVSVAKRACCLRAQHVTGYASTVHWVQVDMAATHLAGETTRPPPT